MQKESNATGTRNRHQGAQEMEQVKNPFLALLVKLDNMKTAQSPDTDEELPTEKAVERMRDILSHLNATRLVPDRLSPSAEGGVAVAFRSGNLYSDIEVLNANVITAVTSNGSGDIDAWEVGPDKSLSATLDAIRGYLGR